MGKIFFFHSSTSVVVNWQPPPPPPLRRLTNSGIRVSGGFSLLWRTFAVRCQTRTPWRWRFVRRLATRSWFSPRKERWREVRTSSVLEQFPDGVQDQDGHSTSTYLGYPPPPSPVEEPDPYSGMTLIPECTLAELWRWGLCQYVMGPLNTSSRAPKTKRAGWQGFGGNIFVAHGGKIFAISLTSSFPVRFFSKPWKIRRPLQR